MELNAQAFVIQNTVDDDGKKRIIKLKIYDNLTNIQIFLNFTDEEFGKFARLLANTLPLAIPKDDPAPPQYEPVIDKAPLPLKEEKKVKRGRPRKNPKRFKDDPGYLQISQYLKPPAQRIGNATIDAGLTLEKIFLYQDALPDRIMTKGKFIGTNAKERYLEILQARANKITSGHIAKKLNLCKDRIGQLERKAIQLIHQKYNF